MIQNREIYARSKFQTTLSPSPFECFQIWKIHRIRADLSCPYPKTLICNFHAFKKYLKNKTEKSTFKFSQTQKNTFINIAENDTKTCGIERSQDRNNKYRRNFQKILIFDRVTTHLKIDFWSKSLILGQFFRYFPLPHLTPRKFSRKLLGFGILRSWRFQRAIRWFLSGKIQKVMSCQSWSVVRFSNFTIVIDKKWIILFSLYINILKI